MSLSLSEAAAQLEHLRKIVTEGGNPVIVACQAKPGHRRVLALRRCLKTTETILLRVFTGVAVLGAGAFVAHPKALMLFNGLITTLGYAIIAVTAARILNFAAGHLVGRGYSWLVRLEYAREQIDEAIKANALADTHLVNAGDALTKANERMRKFYADKFAPDTVVGFVPSDP